MPGPLSNLFADDDQAPDQSNASVAFAEGEPSANPDAGDDSVPRGEDPTDRDDPGQPVDVPEPQSGGDMDAF